MVEACHYPDFRWRDHYLPQMPLLFCVSICPEASITQILEKSRRCLCVDAHLILAINWQIYPHTNLSGSASRPSICCCKDLWLWMNVPVYRSASMCDDVCVGGVGRGGRKYATCGFEPVDAFAPRSVAVVCSPPKLIFKAERSDKQMLGV